MLIQGVIARSHPKCDSLHERVSDHKSQGRGAQSDTVVVELHQDTQAKQQLSGKETFKQYQGHSRQTNKQRRAGVFLFDVMLQSQGSLFYQQGSKELSRKVWRAGCLPMQQISKPPSDYLPSGDRVQTKSHQGLVLASKLQKPVVCLSCAPPLHPSHDPKDHSLYNQHPLVIELPCQKGLAAPSQESCLQELPLQSTRSKAKPIARFLQQCKWVKSI